MTHRLYLKNSYFSFCFYIWKKAKFFPSIKKNNYTSILNFHRVSPNSNPFYEPLHPTVFKESLIYLQKYFDFVGLSELENLESNFQTKPKMVISFDDGYADFVDYALPILDELNIPSNQNIIPHCVETGEPPWNVKIYDFLHQAPLSLVRDIKILGFTEKLNSENSRDKALFGLAITKYLNNYPKSKRQALLSLLSELMLKLDNFKPTSMMILDDCRGLSNRVSLGVHSYSHDVMGLESDAFFQDDFDKCVRFFATHNLGKLDIYAFPYGSHRTEQIEFLLSKDVQKILLVEEKYAQTHKHIYPRFTMYGTSSKEVACRAMGLNAKGAL